MSLLQRKMLEDEVLQQRILIVEDNPDTRRILELTFEHGGYKDIVSAETGAAAIEMLTMSRREKNPIKLVLLDLMLPEMDGFELCERITKDYRLPVIVVTAKHSKETQIKCFELGAEDFIEKPFHNDILRLKVGKILTERLLFNKVEESNSRSKKLFLNTLQAMANILEAKDPYTKFHSENVARYSRRIARKIGFATDQIDVIGVAAILHDIGKIGIQDNILCKPEKLSDEEFDAVKLHPIIAETILESIEEFSPIIRDIKHHHERFDGNGYPDGLQGLRIPLGARIIAVADTFDVMTTGRVYMKARSPENAIDELKRCSGTQFDPAIVELLEECVLEDTELGIRQQ